MSGKSQAEWNFGSACSGFAPVLIPTFVLFLTACSHPGGAQRKLLHNAAEGNAAIVRTLITEEYDVDINGADEAGNTPLMLAAFGGHATVVRLLMSHAANPHLINHDGKNALGLAREQGHEMVVKLLSPPPEETKKPGNSRAV